MRDPREPNSTAIEQVAASSEWELVRHSSHITPIQTSERLQPTDQKILNFKDHCVQIVSSKAVEITDLLDTRAKLLANLGNLPNGTRFYAVAAPHLPNLSYAIGSGELVAQEKITERDSPRSAHKPQTADKIEAREIALQCGLLKQPEWRSIPHLVPDKGTALEFCGISFSELPIEDLVGAARKIPAIAFEDRFKGFELLGNGENIIINSENAQIRKFAELNPAGVSPEQLRTFLQGLTESDFRVQHLTLKTHELRGNQVVEFLSALSNGTWYFKSTTGSLGNQVCKVEVSNHQITHFTIPRIHQELFADLRKIAIENASPLELIDYMVSSRDHGVPVITQAIIEKAIPKEEVTGIVAEQRVVFNFNYTPQYLFSYSKIADKSKVSDEEQAYVNRAQGGSAEPIRTSFRRIIEARLDASPDEVDSLVEDTALRMKLVVSQFADDFIVRTRERKFHYGPLFAVDVCPVWNDTHQQIEFWLLEVQPEPGTLGAGGNLPPNELDAVNKYNDSIDADYNYME